MGLVYIATNVSMPGLLKIGRTSSSSCSKRIKQLSSHSGIPTPFKINYQVATAYFHYVELDVHSKLNPYRIEILREFFRIDLENAIKTLDETVHSINNNPNYFKEVYPRHGLQWDSYEKKELISAFGNNQDILNLSSRFGRTAYEIEVFLNHLGLICTTAYPNAIPRSRIIYSNNNTIETSIKSQPVNDEIATRLINRVETINKKNTKILESDSIPSPKVDSIEDLYLKLKERRLKIAKKDGIPPYIIFVDEVLEKLAINQPTELDDFLKIPGIAYIKAEKYAQYFLPLIRHFKGVEGKLVLAFDKNYQEKKNLTYELTSTGKKLYNALTDLRKALAQDACVPPYMVFSNETLMDVVRVKPRTEDSLLHIQKMGRKKIDWFGRFVIYQVEAHFPESH